MKAEAARRGGFIEINFGLEVPAAAVRRRRKYDTARGSFVISHALSEYLMCVLRNKFS